MATQVNYSKKQLDAMMERYAFELLEPHPFTELATRFRFETTRFGKTLSCHLRTTQGIVLEVAELVEWFESLSETKQAEILAA